MVDLCKDHPLPYPIGESHYSSDTYELLGLIIEKISGQSYFEYVDSYIFQKAGMTNTGNFEIDPDNPPSDIAVDYTNRNSLTDHFVPGERFSNAGVIILLNVLQEVQDILLLQTYSNSAMPF